MPLPTRVKYQTAVQNPGMYFRDPELRSATAECGANGMPLAYSGGFATTFRMRNDDADWAVRCFTSPVAQLEGRYRIIGGHINTNRPRYLVSAALLPDGIQIDAQWHPIIKMQWLSGYMLNSYVENQLQAASKIIKLRGELMELAGEMQAAEMAHGDLQHGNIIVSNGRPRLVDYDGIYLPELKGMVPDELGHKHYQHPQRAREHWGPHMDSFSLIALYVGLSAIAQESGRELWSEFSNGDNILFTKGDFANPAASELFGKLRGIAAIERMSEKFREVCAGPLRSVPPLQEFVSAAGSGNGIFSRFRKVIADALEGTAPTVLAATDNAALLANLAMEVSVHGRIAEKHAGTTKYGKPYLFLNVGEYPAVEFKFKIWSESLEKFEALGQYPANWVGREVQAQGTVGMYGNRLEMTITDPDRLQIID